MSGTAQGAKKATQTILSKDPDFYKKIGARGGRNGHTGGSAKDDRSFWQKLLRRPTKAQIAGRKGGRARRGYRKVTV